MHRTIKDASSGDLYAGVVLLAQGGTSSVTPREAVDALGGIYAGEANTPGNVIRLDANGYINPGFVGDANTVYHSIQGARVIQPGQALAFLITNYDSFRTYSIEAMGGSVDQHEDTITYIAPLTPGEAGFKIDGRLIRIVVENSTPGNLPVAPTWLHPVNGLGNVLRNAVFSVAPYALQTGIGVHAATDWQVSTQSTFLTLVESATVIYGDLTKWSPVNLVKGRDYFARVRFKDETKGYGPWSNTVAFTTYADTFPNIETGKLMPTPATPGVSFGMSIAMTPDATRMVVAEPGFDSDNGAINIYLRTGGVYVLERKLALITTDPDYRLGPTTAINASGDRIAVSCFNRATRNGVVYTYRRSGTSWAKESTIAFPNTGAQNSTGIGFGAALSLDSAGTRLLIGSHCENSVNGRGTDGAAYIYAFNGVDWVQEARIIPSALSLDAHFGFSGILSPDGSLALIGAPYHNNNQGSAFLYVRSGSLWTLLQVLSNSQLTPVAQFGYEVAMSADKSFLAVAAPIDSSSGTKTGTITVFKLVDGVYSRSHTLYPPAATPEARLGRKMVMNAQGTHIAASYRTNATERGYVQLYRLSGPDAIPADLLTGSDTLPGGMFGGKIALSSAGDVMAVTAPWNDFQGQVIGGVYLFGAL